MKKIVVTGATGTIGSRAVTLLAERAGAEVDVTAVVRDPKKATFPSKVNIKQGTYEDAASLKAAFEGAEVVVSITPANSKGAEQAQAVHDAAKAAGVKKVVRVSAIKASPDGPTDNTRQHGKTDAYLKSTGLKYVILRPSFFFQNVAGLVPGTKKDGNLYFGTGDGKIGMIDTRDVADCVVETALSDRFDNQELELSGPRTISFHEVSKALSDVLGRPINYVPVPPEAVAAAVKGFGGDDWTAGIMKDYCAAYASGFGDFTTDAVEKITGHKPRSFETFAKEVVKD